MNSPSRPRPRQAQASRDYDDRATLPPPPPSSAVYQSAGKPGPSSPPLFDNHDAFYDFLDSNRGPAFSLSSHPGPATTAAANAINANTPLQTQPSQMSQQQQQQQQRYVQGGQPNSPSQSRPPLTNSFPPQGGGSSERSRPPSYSGSSRSEEMLVADRPSDSSRIQRQNGRRAPPSKPASGPRPPTSSSGGSSPPRTSSGYTSSHPQIQQAQAQAQAQAHSKSASASNPNLSTPELGASIQRLKSPTVLDHVLQPLDQKVHEYAEFMHRERDEMERLDAEIRALQERRADAETRFLEAKGKHDDYQRQYVNVERAMRGEAALPPPTPIAREHQAPLSRQYTRPMSMQDNDDDDDDDDDLAPPPSSHRRINSQQSFGRTSQKGKTGGRFRFSLFGDR
ncbi:hypothetical protein F4677DRAFT_205468 [Hypoxylon crocopeplum]|nr:hypothetical protein F4677DRAFT_205468 [Hypoxylon crocopeplum]